MANDRLKCEINESIGEIRWTIPTGESVTLHTERLSDAIRLAAMFHGIKQKCGDKAAQERDKATGKSVPLAERLAAIRAEVDRLEAPNAEWNARGQGADSDLIQALIRAGKPDTEELREKVRNLTSRERAALEAHPDVKPHLDAIRAEKGRMVDADKLLDTF